MTRSTSGHREPGATLLKIARLVFSEYVIAAVVQPAISDLQCEIAAVGPKRFERLRARCRGYYAFWRLALVVPFARWPVAAGNAGAVAFPDVVGRLAVGSAVLMLLAVGGPALGVWVAVVAAALAMFAMVIHAWYQRHPSELPDPIERQWRSPQINFSSTEVAGNIGGLIFALGSVLVVSVGLPWVVWFLLVAIAGGCVLAWALVAWRTSHAKARSPHL